MVTSNQVMISIRSTSLTWYLHRTTSIRRHWWTLLVQASNIPGFQRNFIWDIKRASRLIESISLDYRYRRFSFTNRKATSILLSMVERLMSIYYFVKGRFPRKDQLSNLRLNLKEKSAIPFEILNKDEYFTDFRLNLPGNVPGQPNRFHRLDYRVWMIRIERHLTFVRLGTSS